MIDRRALLVGAAAGLSAFAGATAEACTVTGNPHLPFSDQLCRAALRAWIELLNAGPDLSIERIHAQVDNLSVTVDDEEMIDAAVGPGDGTQTETERAYLFYQKFRLSNGRPDPRPIRLTEIHQIRRLRNLASYQFTLERHSYVPAYEDDGGGCTGSSPEYYGQFRTSYIGSFQNNRLRRVRQFPEWYLESRS